MDYHSKLAQPVSCPHCNHEFTKDEFNEVMSTRETSKGGEINIKEVSDISCPDCSKSAILDVITETDSELIAVIHE